jgi:hypothetical protein
MTISRATRKRRLLKLAEVLESVPQKHFDMNAYFRVTYDDGSIEANTGGHDQLVLDSADEVLECGTAACVAGWARVVFRRVWPDYPIAYGGFIEPIADGAAHVLGLNILEAHALFSSKAKHRTPKQAAKRLRALAAEPTR